MNQKDFNDLAASMEEKCGDWKNSKGFSPEARAELLAKVDEMERKKVKVFPRKKRYVVALAATLVLLMGTGVVGDRAWIAGSSDLERESEVTTKVNNDEKNSVLLEEEVINQEIAEKLGIVPLWISEIPEGMVLDSYVIMEDTGWAAVNYLYEEQLICIQMFRDSREGSTNVQWDGESYVLENVENSYGYTDVMEAYCTDEEHQNYGANISYGNGYYNIFGSFDEKEDFLKILKGIYFK